MKTLRPGSHGIWFSDLNVGFEFKLGEEETNIQERAVKKSLTMSFLRAPNAELWQ